MRLYLGQRIRWDRIRHRVWLGESIPFFTPDRASAWRGDSRRVVELVKTYGYAEPCDVSWVDDWVMVRDDPGLVTFKEIFKKFSFIFGGEDLNYPIEIS